MIKNMEAFINTWKQKELQETYNEDWFEVKDEINRMCN